jgi:hypothetical protein
VGERVLTFSSLCSFLFFCSWGYEICRKQTPSLSRARVNVSLELSYVLVST